MYFYLGGWGFWFYILKTDVIQTLFFFNINVQYLKNNYLEHYLLIFLVKKEVHYNITNELEIKPKKQTIFMWFL